jgi:hypothetical protein
MAEVENCQNMHYSTLRECNVTLRSLVPELRVRGCSLITNVRLMFGRCAQSLVI